MRTVVLAGLGMVLMLGAACGDDGSTDSGASSVGSSDGGPTSTSSTDGPTGSTGEPTTAGSTSDPTSGTTSAVDEGTGPTDGTGLDPTGGSDETAIPEVTFGEVLPVIADSCFCHRSAMLQGQLDLRDDTAYSSLVSVPSIQAPGVDRVVPGDPDGSYLYLKLLGDQTTVGGSGTQMPQGGAMLPPEQLDLFRDWILGGANP